MSMQTIVQTPQFVTQASSLTGLSQHYAVVGNASGGATTSGTYPPRFSPTGWRDLISDLSRAQAVGGGASLTLDTFRTPTKAWIFTHAATSANGLLLAFHVDHDLARATPAAGEASPRKAYIHIHTSPMTAGQTGTVAWKFSYTLAKGHNQAAFPAAQTIDLTCTTSATQYQHQITEDTVGVDLLEPDTLVLGYLYRDGAAETCTGDQAALFCDFHYQTDRATTTQKSPSGGWDV